MTAPSPAGIEFRALDHHAPDEAALVALIEAGKTAAVRALPLGWRRWPHEVAGILTEHRMWLAQFALAGEQVVGFKLGYAERKTRFYSWLGGVDPAFRRRGIARRLMADQHAWCAAQGIELVQTSTTNDFRGMLLLNLHSGFDIVGTKTSDGRLSILMEKHLPPAGT